MSRAHLAKAGGPAPGAAPSGPRRVLHVDLHPFFVSVERALDPALRGRPVIVGGGSESGIVAAASGEAQASGVRAGMSIAAARTLCPAAAVRPGDLESYARVSDEVTAVLLHASRRVERPSSDEAYVDLTRTGGASPVTLAEQVKDELQQRLKLDASLGLASSRLAARVASTWARPRGLLVVIPGYEARFLARQSLDALPELLPHTAAALQRAGITTLGALRDVDESTLATAVGLTTGQRLQRAARGEGEEPIPVAAPPIWVQEETPVRDRHADAASLAAMVSALAEKAARRIRCFGLAAGAVTVEVERDQTDRRDDVFEPALDLPADLDAAVRSLAEPLLVPAAGVRTVRVRLSKLRRADGTMGKLFA